MADLASEEEMVVGSTNRTVYSYVATTLGESETKYSSFANGKSYCRTMMLIKTSEFYQRGINVRAYAKLKDGTYVYSDISNMSVYRVADTLYKNTMMDNRTGHEYLYNNILSVVEPSYEKQNFLPKETTAVAATTISPTTEEDITTAIRSYTLVTVGDSSTYTHRDPHKWKLFGSLNGTDWVQLDAVDDGGIDHQNTKKYTYDTDVQTPCQYYMLRIENSGDDGKLYYGSQLSEIFLKGDVVQLSSDTGVELAEHIKEIKTDATTVTGYNSSEVVENLFDGDTSTKLFTNTSTPCSIAWTMKEETSLYSYTLTTANDNADYKNRTLKSWVLYGSDDGSSWETIDTVTDSGIGDVNYADYTYIVDKVGAYKHFKLTVTEGYGSSFQLSEISLKGCALLLENEYEAIFMVG